MATRYTVRVANEGREVMVVDAIGDKTAAQTEARRALLSGEGDTATLERNGEAEAIYVLSVDGYVRRAWP